MNKINVGLAIFIVAMLGACGDPELLEVSDENCRWAFMLQYAEENNLSRPEWGPENNLSKEQVEEFRSKCLRQGYEQFERSEEKVWKFGKD